MDIAIKWSRTGQEASGRKEKWQKKIHYLHKHSNRSCSPGGPGNTGKFYMAALTAIKVSSDYKREGMDMFPIKGIIVKQRAKNT